MDRMRRAGIHYSDLPYYLPRPRKATDKIVKDYINHLAQIVGAPKKLHELPARY